MLTLQFGNERLILFTDLQFLPVEQSISMLQVFKLPIKMMQFFLILMDGK
jgi:hypothetical protein